MKSVVRMGAKGKGRRKILDEAATGDRPRIDARAELIQALIRSEARFQSIVEKLRAKDRQPL